MIAAASVLAMTACGGKKEEAPADNAGAAQEGAAAAEGTSTGGLKAGEYTAKASGMGEINVTVTIDDSGKMTDCKIDGPNETPDLGGKAIPELQKAILDKQSAEVDSVSGATITSTAVKKAVADCLTQAAQ